MKVTPAHTPKNAKKSPKSQPRNPTPRPQLSSPLKAKPKLEKMKVLKEMTPSPKKSPRGKVVATPKPKAEKQPKLEQSQVQSPGSAEGKKMKKSIKSTPSPQTKVKVQGKAGKRKLGKPAPETLKKKKRKAIKLDPNKPVPKLARENVIQALEAVEKAVQSKVKKPRLVSNLDYLLQINFIKPPVPSVHTIKIRVPKTLLSPTSDVCFISTDHPGKKKNKGHDESIDFHMKCFKQAGCPVTEVLPVSKLASEYTEYEARKKLANRFDFFLIDARIAHRWSKLMNKCFLKNKYPRWVKFSMKSTALKENVDKALTTMVMNVSAGLSTSICFGQSSMGREQLADNIMAIAEKLSDMSIFPRGFINVRSLYARASNDIYLPMYLSTVSPDDVPNTRPRKRKREVEPVVDEVTTVPGKLVKVHPSGEVETIPDPAAESNDEFEMSDENDDVDDEEFTVEMGEDTFNEFLHDNAPTDDESSDEENEIEAAEQEFLREARDHQDELEKSFSSPKKKMKVENIKSEFPQNQKSAASPKGPKKGPKMNEVGKKSGQGPQPSAQMNGSAKKSPKNAKGNKQGKGQPGAQTSGAMSPKNMKGKQKKGPQGTNQTGGNAKMSPKVKVEPNQGKGQPGVPTNGAAKMSPKNKGKAKKKGPQGTNQTGGTAKVGPKVKVETNQNKAQPGRIQVNGGPNSPKAKKGPKGGNSPKFQKDTNKNNTESKGAKKQTAAAKRYFNMKMSGT